MHKAILVLVCLASGGFITSFVEYKLKYNLVDLIKDKILGLFGAAKAETQELKAEVKQKL